MRELTTLTEFLLDVADPTQPRITFYDDATGERTELSTLTLANWAAKTANMLRDDYAVRPGDIISVAVPTHWQTAGIYLGAWWVGASVDIVSDSIVKPLGRVGFCTSETLTQVDKADEVLMVSRHPFALPATNLPLGVDDYPSSARIHGDLFRSSSSFPGEVFPGITLNEAIETVQNIAAKRNWTKDTRLLSSLEWDTPTNILTNFAVLGAGGSLVQSRNHGTDTAKLDGRARTEKVTALLS